MLELDLIAFLASEFNAIEGQRERAKSTADAKPEMVN